ncbi:MAG: DUF4124 domain-containing protein [Betaproteobacteria bacterium]
MLARHRLVVVAAIAFPISTAHAQVYKCVDDAGKTIYADAPCARGGKALKVPGDAGAAANSATVCTQLQDERRRLASEAARDARRGRSESASTAQRRKTLTQQYERRCMGISRSGG